MGVATGTVEVDGQHRTGEVQMQFGRVSEGRGVMSLGGDLLDADVRFGLHHSRLRAGSARTAAAASRSRPCA